MRNIFNAALVPVLAAFAFGCTSTTALQTSEPDDLYYASSDKTVRQEMSAGATQSTYSEDNTSSAEGNNPEYYDPEAASRTSITNNYYYDTDRYYTGRGRRNYMYYNDPFYSPFGYSAAYCYGIYDPFCFPGYYPYSGITVSIGYGWGSPWGYGYGYRPYGGYGYRPYDMYGYGYGYGGGYGGYYQGFYDGYHAGNGYGYGYNRKRVQYGPRGERSVVPTNSSTAGSGRPASPGRIGDNNSGRVNVEPGSGRVGRVAPAQSGSGQPANTPVASPGRAARPGSQAGRPAGQPGREATVRPENYQFQNQEAPSLEQNRPNRTRDVIVAPSQQAQPQQERPTYQQERPAEQAAPMQQQRPAREQYSRPERPAQPVQRETRTAPSYNNDRPSYQDYSPSRSSGGSGGSSAPSRSGGRPRN